MKILHLCLGCFYIDNYTYQENMIPKHHKEMGHEVYIVASTISFDKNGNTSYVKSESYINEYGIPVKRLEYSKKTPQRISKFLRRFEGTYSTISEIKPDLIFIHGPQFSDMNVVVKYLSENKETKVIVDNHADFSNSARNFLSKHILHRILWKHYAHLVLPYTTKYYGVLPARVEFLKDIYKIPEEKVELLVMGADDEKIIQAQSSQIKNNIRDKFNIKEDDFLIITGGKIDTAKKQILNLMEAVQKNYKVNVKLIVFGSIIPEMKNDVMSLVDGEKVQYIGWLPASETYNYLYSSDLVIFPGRHSVLWEQTVALEIPLIVKYWEGTSHIDIGGNCKFLYSDSLDEIQELIKDLTTNRKNYLKMKNAATSAGAKKFLYSNISAKSIDVF